jgi:hypothetical protein
MTKEQWLNQTIMFDEWGRPPSLADVPLTYGARKKAFELRSYTENEIDKLYKESNSDDCMITYQDPGDEA